MAILLIDRPDIDIRTHEKAVREAAGSLESQSYLQRNGDLFEFLTDTEKDIEVEIKNTEIDESQVADFSARSSSPMSSATRKSAMKAMGRITLTPGNLTNSSSAETQTSPSISSRRSISITPMSTTLAMQNMGKAELLAILPADTRLIDQARLYLKTQKYVQQNTGGRG